MLPSHSSEKTGSSSNSSYKKALEYAWKGTAVVGGLYALNKFSGKIPRRDDVTRAEGFVIGYEAGQKHALERMGNSSNCTLVCEPSDVNTTAIATSTNQTDPDTEVDDEGKGKKSKEWGLDTAGRLVLSADGCSFVKRAFVRDPSAESLNGEVNDDGIPRKYKVDTMDTNAVPSRISGGAKTIEDESKVAETAEAPGSEDGGKGGRFGPQLDHLSK